MLTARVLAKWSKIIPVCGIIVVKRKITAKLGGDFPFMVDPTGIEPATSRLRIWRSPSLATGPNYRFLHMFQNKKRSLIILSFSTFRRHLSPKLRVNFRSSMCTHIDANAMRSHGVRFLPTGNMRAYGWISTRERDRNYGAFPNFAIDFNFAVMILHSMLYDRKAKAGAAGLL